MLLSNFNISKSIIKEKIFYLIHQRIYLSFLIPNQISLTFIWQLNHYFILFFTFYNSFDINSLELPSSINFFNFLNHLLIYIL